MKIKGELLRGFLCRHTQPGTTTRNMAAQPLSASLPNFAGQQSISQLNLPTVTPSAPLLPHFPTQMGCSRRKPRRWRARRGISVTVYLLTRFSARHNDEDFNAAWKSPAVAAAAHLPLVFLLLPLHYNYTCRDCSGKSADGPLTSYVCLPRALHTHLQMCQWCNYQRLNQLCFFLFVCFFF